MDEVNCANTATANTPVLPKDANKAPKEPKAKTIKKIDSADVTKAVKKVDNKIVSFFKGLKYKLISKFNLLKDFFKKAFKKNK